MIDFRICKHVTNVYQITNSLFFWSFSLLILVLSKKILITFVKTKPVRGKWRKHDTRGSMAPFSHLLWLAYGLYMTTATLLNGHLYSECYFIALILCIPTPIFWTLTYVSSKKSANGNPPPLIGYLVNYDFLNLH